ncbi:MAG: response regulator [Leptolyngbyaceae cyanobacterium]
MPLTIAGDITRLRQVLVNLLTNAVKFTEKGEVFLQIQLESASEPNNSEKPYLFHFSVKDCGIGIPPERMDRLFKPFSQVDASTTRKYGGTGLGLVICKQLVEAMGGTIWVESIVSQGTTFHFTIGTSAHTEATTESQSADSSKLQHKKVLVVDDNATNRKLLQAKTQAWGMQPVLVCSGPEALTQLQHSEDSFDIAILDMQMPGMDGLQLAQAIHGTTRYRDLPLVMLTSVVRETIAAAEIKKHFKTCLHKPVKHSRLYEVLCEALFDVRISLSTSAKESPINPQPLAESHPLKILVAEDNVVNQKLAIHLLLSLGYRIEVAANGIEALEALARQSFDLVLMDVQMPEMDGLTASQKIREKYHPCPKIVAVTANAMAGDREQYLASGMDDYISKPIRVEELVAVLKNTQPLALEQDQTPDQAQPAPMASVEPDPFDGVSASRIATSNNESDNQPEKVSGGSIYPLSTNDIRAIGIDTQPLIEMHEAFGGNWQTVGQVVTLFLKEAPSLIIQLHQAAQADDLEAINAAAHTLKSNSAMMGANTLTQYCTDLEAQSLRKTLSSADAQTMANSIQENFELLKTFLAELIASDFALLQ